MSQRGKGKLGGHRQGSSYFQTDYRHQCSKTVYVPPVSSPYEMPRKKAFKPKRSNNNNKNGKRAPTKTVKSPQRTATTSRNGGNKHGASTSQSPKNLNDIKAIDNDKIICNNVMVSVEGCYAPMVRLDDILESEFSMNDVENSVVRWINTHGKGKTILGCMAWLSNKKILRCLIENAKRVLFLVNDEDYSAWTQVLRYYDQLPRFKEPLHSAFFGSKSLLRALDRDHFGNKKKECEFEAVRCFGNSAFSVGGATTSSSLMHNKIIIFCDEMRLPGGKLVEAPTSFITGSYNCTDNATNNLENAVFIKSKKGAEHCFYQFSIIMAHSRPLRRS